MKSYERILFRHLLDLAASTFSNNGCNDVDLVDLGLSTEDRRELHQRYHEWNGDPEEFDPESEYECGTDFALMRFLSEQLGEDE